ncbi:MAG: threonine ammonia-lyase, biosynthetic [Methylococcales bacterium]|nr:threonine ammonia-lyase, biosynthetic [Methylococcales bacterium]
MLTRYIERILRARVYEAAVETPLDYAPVLSRRLRNDVYLKREDLQPVFSFKIRGAYNKITQLSEAERQQGVIASSAGNHAQGVARAAQMLGIAALIVMPKTTPAIKVNAVRAKGADIVLHGDSYDDAYQHAQTLAASNGMTFVHPYDDPDVIAGQGTLAMELLRQKSGALDAVFVPVGGGGLLAGITAYIKFVQPKVKIIAVEPEDSNCLQQALQAGKPVRLDRVGLFTDGVAVRQIGAEPFAVVKSHVDQVVTVSTDEICAAIKDIFDDTRSIAEPAGALALAGLKRYVEAGQLQGQQLVAITSGANMNFDRLRYVAERAQVGEQQEILLAVTIPETPGSFLKFCRLLGGRGITEFNYRYADPGHAHIFVGLTSTGGADDRARLLATLQSESFPVIDMTQNELAKEHFRYMVGGHATVPLAERLYDVQFPERPGALLDFLEVLGARWNISLFHYRNHGAAFGRVLMGVQIQDAETAMFCQYMDQSGFAYSEQTGNPAYTLFAGWMNVKE